MAHYKAPYLGQLILIFQVKTLMRFQFPWNPSKSWRKCEFLLVRLRCNSHNKIVIQHTAFIKVWHVIQCAYKTLNFHYSLLLFKSILNFNRFSFSPIVFFSRLQATKLVSITLEYILNHKFSIFITLDYFEFFVREK